MAFGIVPCRYWLCLDQSPRNRELGRCFRLSFTGIVLRVLPGFPRTERYIGGSRRISNPNRSFMRRLRKGTVRHQNVEAPQFFSDNLTGLARIDVPSFGLIWKGNMA
jgi:hypothetical protein